MFQILKGLLRIRICRSGHWSRDPVPIPDPILFKSFQDANSKVFFLYLLLIIYSLQKAHFNQSLDVKSYLDVKILHKKCFSKQFCWDMEGSGFLQREDQRVKDRPSNGSGSRTLVHCMVACSLYFSFVSTINDKIIQIQSPLRWMKYGACVQIVWLSSRISTFIPRSMDSIMHHPRLINTYETCDNNLSFKNVILRVGKEWISVSAFRPCCYVIMHVRHKFYKFLPPYSSPICYFSLTSLILTILYICCDILCSLM